MITWHPDYLYSFDLNSLDNNKIFEECLTSENYLKSLFPPTELGVYGNYTGAIHKNYNLFTLPNKEISKLYRELVKYCLPLLNNKKDYWVQCWFNVFRKGEKVNWHAHWPPEKKVWHGFYCVNVGESYTEYKIPNVKDIIKIPSKEGRLVFGKSDGDEHKSSPWYSEEKPRITIAFDVIPVSSLTQDNSFYLNHYIPFK